MKRPAVLNVLPCLHCAELQPVSEDAIRVVCGTCALEHPGTRLFCEEGRVEAEAAHAARQATHAKANQQAAA